MLSNSTPDKLEPVPTVKPQRAILSARERECLVWLGRGLRVAAIADQLGIAAVTVHLHLKNARHKLNSATREEALAKAILSQQILP